MQHITTKFGSFVYAPFKCPYDPYSEGEQLEKMIPGIGGILKETKISSPNKSDLMFKIVKSADNNLSIVKKIELSTKCDKDEAKKPPEAVTDLKKKVGRPSLSPGSTLPRQYHVMRRTSNVRGDDRGKVKVVILKRKTSLPSAFATDKSDSMPPKKKRCSQSTTPVDVKGSVDSTTPTKTDNVDSDKILKPCGKPIKLSSPSKISPVVLIGIMPDANQLLKDKTSVSPKPTEEVNNRTDDKVDPITIVEPAESGTPCGEFTIGKDPLENSIEEQAPLVSKTLPPATNNQPTVENTLIPMEDVKKEVMSVDDDGTDDTSNKSSETTQRINDHIDLDATIKTEPMLVDNDTETVQFSNGIVTSPSTPTVEKTPAELFITRGNITVKDISKLKNPGNPSLKTQFLNLRTLKKTVLRKSSVRVKPVFEFNVLFALF